MTELNYEQRKALRRLGRGQTIKRSMRYDSVIRGCYSTDHYVHPRRDMNIVEWCDWKEEARRVNQPRINQRGRELLAQLDQEESCPE